MRALAAVTQHHRDFSLGLCAGDASVLSVGLEVLRAQRVVVLVHAVFHPEHPVTVLDELDGEAEGAAAAANECLGRLPVFRSFVGQPCVQM
jgi:hypothetical protein